MENLPEELKLEILLRLPVKSLVCLKCVSKSWRSRISNPNFPQLHLQLSPYSQRCNRILLTTTSPRMKSIDINASLHDDSAITNLHFSPLKPHTRFLALGSCRGLVLLRTTKRDRLFLWNPVTGAYKQIPLPPQCKSGIPILFWYDESLDDYFIGLSFYPKRPHFGLLTLRTKSYKDYLDHNPAKIPHCCTLFNGAIHFIAYRRKAFPSRDPEVIAIDIRGNNVSRQVPLPTLPHLYSGRLIAHEGCLALTGGETPHEIGVWVMREYGVKSSWTKLVTVSRLQPPGVTILPFISLKEKDRFISSCPAKDGCRGLSKWSDKGEQLEHRTYPDLVRLEPPISYTETLLPLP